MKVNCVWEHNGEDTLLYAVDLVGAYTRGTSKKIAIKKMSQEINSYQHWLSKMPVEEVEIIVTQEKASDLKICDADSDVLFEEEKKPLSLEEYMTLKKLVLKSAEDFLALYESIPDKDITCLPVRNTFYGTIPRTAREMYEHTKNVNEYYFAEIDVDADNEGTILECRQRGLDELEKHPGFLENLVIEGSYGEEWSLRKVMRRFIWHDRIHAKAMYRMACKVFGEDSVANVFYF